MRKSLFWKQQKKKNRKEFTCVFVHKTPPYLMRSPEKKPNSLQCVGYFYCKQMKRKKIDEKKFKFKKKKTEKNFFGLLLNKRRCGFYVSFFPFGRKSSIQNLTPRILRVRSTATNYWHFFFTASRAQLFFSNDLTLT